MNVYRRSFAWAKDFLVAAPQELPADELLDRASAEVLLSTYDVIAFNAFSHKTDSCRRYINFQPLVNDLELQPLHTSPNFAVNLNESVLEKIREAASSSRGVVPPVGTL